MPTIQGPFKAPRPPLAALARRAHRSVGVGMAFALIMVLVSSRGVAPIRAASAYDTHQGIDKCGDIRSQVVNGVTITWQQRLIDLWNNSPFYNYGLYIGGAEGAYVGCISTTTFVSQVRLDNFGMFPLWDDLQPPCTGNHDLISTNVTTAQSQGVTSAHNAQSAMSTYGFTYYDDVWLDIEHFTESNTSCKADVHAYIQGWDSILSGYLDAGVYVNQENADSLASLATPPNAISISDWTRLPNTVWGFSNIPNDHWTYDQRIHQYRGPTTYYLPFGCLGSGCTDGTIAVDVDCADAWIDGGYGTSDSDSDESNEIGSPTAEPYCNSPSQ